MAPWLARVRVAEWWLPEGCHWLAGYQLAGWLAGWLAGGWLAGWWLAGWLAGWLMDTLAVSKRVGGDVQAEPCLMPLTVAVLPPVGSSARLLGWPRRAIAPSPHSSGLAPESATRTTAVLDALRARRWHSRIGLGSGPRMAEGDLLRARTREMVVSVPPLMPSNVSRPAAPRPPRAFGTGSSQMSSADITWRLTGGRLLFRHRHTRIDRLAAMEYWVLRSRRSMLSWPSATNAFVHAPTRHHEAARAMGFLFRQSCSG